MLGAIQKLFGNSTDYKELVQKGAVIIDVRSPGEYSGGHIPGSLNIPVEVIAGKVQEIKKQNKPVITCCRSGMRSATAAQTLKQAGIEAYNGGPWNSLLSKI